MIRKKYYKYLSILLFLFSSLLFHESKATSYNWVGTTNLWSSPSNWSPFGIPGAADNVSIGSAPYAPFISSPDTVFNLTINPGGSLNGSGYPITVNGNFINNGTFSSSLGIVFGGTVAQNISGSTVTSFNSFVNKNTSAVVSCSTPFSSTNTTLNASTHLDLGILTGYTLGYTTGTGTLLLSASPAGTTVFPSASGSFFQAGGGTVEYNSPNSYTIGANPNGYNNVAISSGGIKSIVNNETLAGDLHVLAGTTMLNNCAGAVTADSVNIDGVLSNSTGVGSMTVTGGNFTVGTTGSVVSFPSVNGLLTIQTGNLLNNGSFTGGKVQFTNTSASQSIQGDSCVFGSLQLNKGTQSLNLATVPNITIINSLDFISGGTLVLGSSNLVLSPTSTITGYSSSNTIGVAGSGQIIQQGSSPTNYVGKTYPMSIGGLYSPFVINALAATGFAANGSISIKANIDGTCTNCVKRYLSLSSNGITSVSNFQFDFSYDAGDAVGTPGPQVYRFVGTNPFLPIGAYVNSSLMKYGVNATGNNFIDGIWKVISLPILIGTITPTSFCPGAPILVPYTVSSAFLAGNIFTAQLSDNTGSFTAPVNIGTLSSTTSGTINATIPLSATPGSVYQIQIVSSNPIAQSPPSMTFTINPLPTVTTLTPAAICSGTSTNISLASTVAGCTYSWPTPVVTGGVSGATAGSTLLINQVLTTLITSGTATYAVTATSPAGCIGPVKNLIQTVNPIPSVNPVTPPPICSGSSTNVFLSSPIAGASFSWPVPIVTGGITGSSSGVSISSINQILTDLGTTGTVTYSVTASAAGCIGAPQNIVQTVNAMPTVLAGSSIPVCANNPNVSLSTATKNSATLSTNWTSSGSGAFIPNSATLNSTYIPSAGDISSGSIILTLTGTGTAPCPNSTSTKTVTITPTPTVSAGASQTVCANNTAVSLNGTVTIASGGTWTGGTGTFVPNANSLITTYTPSASEISAGTVNLTLTSTGNGNCLAVISNTTITITAAPTINAGANQTVCANNPAVSLNGTVTIASGGTWTGGTGTFAPNANSLTTTYTPSASEISSGIVNLTLTSTGNGNCLAVISNTSITITSAPTAFAGSNQTVCAANPNVNLYGIVTVATGGVWSGGTGTFTPNANSLTTTYTPSALEISSGVSNLVLTTTGNGNCNAATSPIAITITPSLTPSITIAPDQNNVCSGTTITFTASPVNGGSTPTYQWTLNGVSAGTNNATYSSATFANGDVIKATMISSATCVSPTSATSNSVTVVISPSSNIPDANFRTWLTSNYPTCMCGNNLITNCPPIVNLASLNLSSLGITDLTGIQYFTGLHSLNVSSDNLTTFPLPATLDTLICASASLTTLPTLPTTLKYLDCGNNSIISLPTLPTGLQTLYCNNNAIPSLPILPTNLIYLNTSFNQLTNLPSLPNTLCTLVGTNNPNPASTLCYPNTPTCGSFTADIISCNPTILSFSPTSACIGDSISITGYNFIGTTSVLVNGQPSGFSYKSNTLIVAAVPAGSSSGVITVTATGGTVNSSSSLNINPSPMVTLSAPSFATVCSGNSTSFTVSLTTGTGPFSYTLTNGTDNFSFTGQNSPAASTITPTVSGTWDIITVSDAFCSSAGPFGSQAVAVTSSILTTPGITSSSDTLCSGQNTLLTINATENGVTYTAIDNATNAVGNPVTGNGAAQIITIPFSQLNSSINTITVQASLAGCSTVTLTQSDTIYKSNLTTPNITGNLPTLCAPDSAVFSVPNTFTKYQWYYGSTSNFAMASELINAETNATSVFLPGYYFVKLYDIYGCSTITAGQNIDYGNAVPTITQSNNTGMQVDLTCSSITSYYQWYVADTSGKLKYIEGASNASFTTYFDGNYYIAIKYNDCYIYSNVTTVAGMAGGSILKQGFFQDSSSIEIPKIWFTKDIEIYPNPGNGVFEVQYLSTSNETSSATLYSSQGNMIARKEVTQQGFVSVPFNEPGLENGIYFIEVIQDGTSMRKKIMIQK
jgi:hypothetical protein